MLLNFLIGAVALTQLQPTIPNDWQFFTGQAQVVQGQFLDKLIDGNKVWLGLETGIIEYDISSGNEKRYYAIKELPLLDVKSIVAYKNKIVFGTAHGVVAYNKSTDTWELLRQMSEKEYVEQVFTDGKSLWITYTEPFYEGAISYVYEIDTQNVNLKSPTEYIGKAVLSEDKVWFFGQNYGGEDHRLFNVTIKGLSVNKIDTLTANNQQINFKDSENYPHNNYTKFNDIYVNSKDSELFILINVSHDNPGELIRYNNKRVTSVEVPKNLGLSENARILTNVQDITYISDWNKIVIYDGNRWSKINLKVTPEKTIAFNRELGFWAGKGFYSLTGEKRFELALTGKGPLYNNIGRIVPLADSLLIFYFGKTEASQFWPKENKWIHYKERSQEVQELAEMKPKNGELCLSGGVSKKVPFYDIISSNIIGTQITALSTYGDDYYVATDKALYKIPKKDFPKAIEYKDTSFWLEKGDPSGWYSVKNPANRALLAVDAVSSNYAVAVGKGGTVIQWNGSKWNLIEPPLSDNSLDIVVWGRKNDLIDVDTVSPDNIWALSHSKIFYWNGKRWEAQKINIPDGNIELKKISMASKNKGFVVGKFDYRKGNKYDYGNDGLLEFRNGEWYYIDLKTKDFKLTSIKMATESEGWAGGYDVLLRYNGKEWIVNQQNSVGYLLSLDSIKSDEAWFLFQGGLLKYSGGNLKNVAIARNVDKLTVAAPDDLWMLSLNYADDSSLISSQIMHYDGNSFKLSVTLEKVGISDHYCLA